MMNQFANLNNEEKADAIRQNKGCYQCLKVGHLARSCYSQKKRITL